MPMIPYLDTVADYYKALKRVEELFQLKPEAGTKDADELVTLSFAISDYERRVNPHKYA